MSIKLSKVAYNRRDSWPGFAEIHNEIDYCFQSTILLLFFTQENHFQIKKLESLEENTKRNKILLLELDKKRSGNNISTPIFLDYHLYFSKFNKDFLPLDFTCIFSFFLKLCLILSTLSLVYKIFPLLLIYSYLI